MTEALDGWMQTAAERMSLDPKDPGGGSEAPEPGAGPGAPEGGMQAQKNREEVPSGLARLFPGSLQTSARSMDAAYGLVGAVLGLGFLGWLLDKYFGTAPACLLGGLLLGVVVGLYTLARAVLWKQ